MILIFGKSCYTSEEKLYFLPPYPYDGKYHFTLPKNEPVCTRKGGMCVGLGQEADCLVES